MNEEGARWKKEVAEEACRKRMERSKVSIVRRIADFTWLGSKILI